MQSEQKVTDEQLHNLSIQLATDVDAYCVKEHRELEDGYRWHLGASVIGDECLRKIWYGYRWYSVDQPNARMVRLFERGHLEENRVTRWLQGCGYKIITVDANTGKQYRYSAVKGHYGGSFDGVAIIPEFEFPLLIEDKTHNSKSFTNFVNGGLFKSKPIHYNQMCAYGHAFGLEYGLYFPINKNDDDIKPTIVWLDWQKGIDLEQRAEYIITTRIAPPKISNLGTHYKCKTCSHLDVCQYKGKPQVTCRSCEKAFPTENGEWLCALYQRTIPRHIAVTGCPSYSKLESDKV